MRLYILFFATLVAGSYSQTASPNDTEQGPLLERPDFWNAVINEISDDVNGASSCVSAIETFIEENPEVVAAVAKRSVAEHILSKRGVVQFFKKWINKLNPIKYFYDCLMFVKDKGVEIYDAIEHPTETEHEISEGIEEAALRLSELYKGGVTNIIKDVDKVKDHLDRSEKTNDPDKKILYNTISGVQSKLHSFNAGLRKEDAEKMFLNLIKVFPYVGESLSKLDWDSIFSNNKPSSSPLLSPKKVTLMADNMKHFELAHNIMVIMNNASKYYPTFSTEEYPYGMDLASGASCITFLSNTTQFQQSTKSVSHLEKLRYLEEARKCGIFVTKHTTDDQDTKSKSAILAGRFLESIDHSRQFLVKLEYYFRIGEKPVKPLTGEKKMLADAARKIRKYLKSSMTEDTRQFLLEAFDAIVPTLKKVEEITSDWSLIKKEGKKEDSTFKPGSPYYRLVNLLNEFSVIPNVNSVNSFLKVLSFATLNPFLETTWL